MAALGGELKGYAVKWQGCERVGEVGSSAFGAVEADPASCDKGFIVAVGKMHGVSVCEREGKSDAAARAARIESKSAARCRFEASHMLAK
jgi:hypothetical protein